jgi:hypothetical protein
LLNRSSYSSFPQRGYPLSPPSIEPVALRSLIFLILGSAILVLCFLPKSETHPFAILFRCLKITRSKEGGLLFRAANHKQKHHVPASGRLSLFSSLSYRGDDSSCDDGGGGLLARFFFLFSIDSGAERCLC